MLSHSHCLDCRWSRSQSTFKALLPAARFTVQSIAQNIRILVLHVFYFEERGCVFWNIHERRVCYGQKATGQQNQCLTNNVPYAGSACVVEVSSACRVSQVLFSTCETTVQFLMPRCSFSVLHTHTGLAEQVCCHGGSHLSCVLVLPCPTGQTAAGGVKPRAQSCQGYYVSAPK